MELSGAPTVLVVLSTLAQTVTGWGKVRSAYGAGGRRAGGKRALRNEWAELAGREVFERLETAKQLGAG